MLGLSEDDSAAPQAPCRYIWAAVSLKLSKLAQATRSKPSSSFHTVSPRLTKGFNFPVCIHVRPLSHTESFWHRKTCAFIDLFRFSKYFKARSLYNNVCSIILSQILIYEENILKSILNRVPLYEHGMITPRVRWGHAYVGSNQELSNWTYDALNKREVRDWKPGYYPGLVKS